jgi:hypothetical protein
MTPGQLLEKAAKGDPPAAQEHHGVEPEVCHLLHQPGVSLAAEGRGHHLNGLLAHLSANRRLSLGQKPGDIGTG